MAHLVKDANLAKFLGKRLREIRMARGLRQEDMQERGISPKYYQRIEAGNVNLTLRSLVKIASALRVSVLDLFCRRNEGSLRKIKDRKINPV